MRQLVLRAPRTVRIEGRAEPARPTKREVLVRSELSVISAGTERRIYLGLPVPNAVDLGFRRGLTVRPRRTVARPRFEIAAVTPARPPRFPTSLGYNTVGLVEVAGGAVTSVKSGQRVMTLAPHAECHLLADWEVVPIPASVPSDQAVLSYLATLGLSALRRLRFEPGETVLVQGLGLVGLTAALTAAACGARVLATDPSPFRREIAAGRSSVGAVLDPASSRFDRDLGRAAGSGPIDHVIETVGSAAALADAVRIVRRRGGIAVIALHPDTDVSTTLSGLFHEKECALISCANDPMVDPDRTTERFTVAGNIATVLDLMARGQLSLHGILTHTFDIAQVDRAYAMLEPGFPDDYLGIGLRWT